MRTPNKERSLALRKSLEQVRRDEQAAPARQKQAGTLPWLIGGAGVVALTGVLIYNSGDDPLDEAANLPDATQTAAPLALAQPLQNDAEPTLQTAVETAAADAATDADASAPDLVTQNETTQSVDEPAQQDDEPAQQNVAAEQTPDNADPAERERLRAELQALRGERDRLSQNLNAAQSELQQTRSQLDEYQQMTVNATRQLGAAEEQIDRLKTQPAAAPADANSAELNQLREKLAAVQLKADSATGVVDEVARKLDLELDLKNWDGDEKAGNTVRTALIDRLDQSLADKNAYAGTEPPAAAYSNAIHNGDAAKLQASLAALKPKRRNANFAPDDIKLEQVHFSSGSNQLTVGGQRKAALIAKLFAQENVPKLKVIGFSDTVGSAQINLKISERRAQSVADSLVAAGVPRERIEVIASGEENLPEPTRDGVNEPLNRCVAIVAAQS